MKTTHTPSTLINHVTALIDILMNFYIIVITVYNKFEFSTFHSTFIMQKAFFFQFLTEHHSIPWLL